MNTFLTVAIFLGYSLGTICLWKIRWRPERWKKSPRKIRASSSSYSISCNEYGRISEVCRLVFVISAANVILFFDSDISHWYSKLGRAARCDVYDPRDRSGGVTDIDHSNTTTAYIFNIICKEVNRAGDVFNPRLTQIKPQINPDWSGICVHQLGVEHNAICDEQYKSRMNMRLHWKQHSKNLSLITAEIPSTF